MENDPRLSADPASIEGEGVAFAEGEGGRIDFGSVAFVITVTVSDEVELAIVKERGPVCALTDPTLATLIVRRHVVGILNEVCTAVVPFDFDVFNDDMGVSDKMGVELLVTAEGKPRLTAEVLGEGESLHGRFLAFVTISPSSGDIVIHIGVAEFHAGSIAIGEIRPVALGEVIDFIGHVSIGINEADELATITEAALPVTDDIAPRVSFEKARGVCGDHKVAVALDDGASWEFEADAACELPPAKADGIATAVVKFDELARALIGRSIIHDFIDDDISLTRDGIVWSILGVACASVKFTIEELETFFAMIAVETGGTEHGDTTGKEDVEIAILIGSEDSGKALVATSWNGSGERNGIGEALGR